MAACFSLFLSIVLLLTSTTFSVRTTYQNVIKELDLSAQNHANNVVNDSAAASASRIGSVATVENLGHHAGYFSLPNTRGARMFYYFFESRRNNIADPVVIWLTGGPGCSSALNLFYENGPFHITNNLTLVWNDFGWDKISNIIFVDQPTGTGFSYSSSKDDIRRDEIGVSNDLYSFLQAFFSKYPQYAKNDFYIAGASYGGHYVPALASRVNQGNKNNEGTFINLKGFAIGDGLTNSEIQYKALPDYALDNKMINQLQYKDLIQTVTMYEEAIKACGTKNETSCETEYKLGNAIMDDILSIADGINYYDIRKKCEGDLCYDFSNQENFLNQSKVREALGVGNIKYETCSSTVYDAMILDIMRNLDVGIPALLEDGVKVLVYVGEYDFICNWLGNLRWVQAMKWSGQNDFLAAPTTAFTVNGVEAGLLKGRGPLLFLKVHNAGHFVTMDQPQASLEMLQRWIQGNL